MHPLLYPEKYAVPYESYELKTILNDLGWQADVYTENYKSVSLYCIMASKTDEIETNEEEVIKRINKVWNRKLKDASISYARIIDHSSSDNYMNTIQNLTMIASIVNYPLSSRQ